MAIDDAIQAAIAAQRRSTERRGKPRPTPEWHPAPVTAAYMAESDFAASVESEYQELMEHRKRAREGVERLREMGIPVP